MGGLDAKMAKHVDGFARGGKSKGDERRRLRPGAALVREYQGELHTVTVVQDGYLWREATYASLSIIARAITGTLERSAVLRIAERQGSHGAGRGR